MKENFNFLGKFLAYFIKNVYLCSRFVYLHVHKRNIINKMFGFTPPIPERVQYKDNQPIRSLLDGA